MSRLRSLLPTRIIVDRERRFGSTAGKTVAYEYGLAKEEVARRLILERRSGDATRMRFLDIGAGEGGLEYLLSIDRNLTFLPAATAAANRQAFDELYEYNGLELETQHAGFIGADICSSTFHVDHAELGATFDVVYSNNVFEHLRRPWLAARNAIWLLQPGGICITIAPFSIRYHESPADYFRFTHTGLSSLFEDAGDVRTLVSGYDITGRRNDWQGMGAAADVCPEDRFGAWRENWFVINVCERVG
jgi:SAM-dependent methyltransferase